MILLLAIILLFFIISTHFILKSRNHDGNLPPSPPALPIIGHLHMLSLPLHRTLARLSDRYGPTLLLLFGSRSVLVVSSPSAVEECFVRNDVALANRPRFPHAKHITYNYTALAAASYGPTLRNLRRVATAEIFSPARIRSLAPLFDREVKLMVGDLLAGGSGVNYAKVDMGMKFSELMFNVLMKILCGKRYFGVNKERDAGEGRRFHDAIEDLFSALDATNPEDFLPFLKYVGFKWLENRMARIGREIDQLFQEMIEERRRERGKEEGTVIDVLLSLQDTDGAQYTDELIKGMTLTLIAAGTHTTAATMEWTMSLLINHPESLQKVRDEIEHRVGPDRLVDHTDIQNLSYLHNVIKETLRLFPTVPLLLPHESSSECTVSGFSIPSGTILFANAYAVHRDPKIWTEPTKFMPERFEDSGSMHGSKVYFPFGLGRRSCPGEGLALLVVGLTLGALVQCFEWERVGKEEVDMSEKSGITMTKAKHLEAMYRPRRGMADVINNV